MVLPECQGVVWCPLCVAMASFCQASCNIVLLSGHESVFSYSYEGLILHSKGNLHFTDSVQHQECVSAQLPAMVEEVDPCSLSGARSMVRLGTNVLTQVNARHHLPKHDKVEVFLRDGSTLVPQVLIVLPLHLCFAPTPLL